MDQATVVVANKRGLAPSTVMSYSHVAPDLSREAVHLMAGRCGTTQKDEERPPTTATWRPDAGGTAVRL